MTLKAESDYSCAYEQLLRVRVMWRTFAL